MKRRVKKTPLALLREQLDFAQWDVAEEMKISQPTYSLYETGRRRSETFENEAREAIGRLVRRQGEAV